MEIKDEFDNIIDINRVEKQEQLLCEQFINENDVVLELGARYGSVSCTINLKLKYKTNQVSVEPDSRVWKALDRNKFVNNCQFHIIKGFISKKKLGLIFPEDKYATTSVYNDNSNLDSFTLDEISKKFNLSFSVLVADCEGFLESFFDENPDFYDRLRLIIFEADYEEKCNYKKIRENLVKHGFIEVLGGHQNVWIKRMCIPPQQYFQLYN